MTCPSCKSTMTELDHGRCRNCGEYCGCSFNPTLLGDYCHHHRPSPKAKKLPGEVPVGGKRRYMCFLCGKVDEIFSGNMYGCRWHVCTACMLALVGAACSAAEERGTGHLPVLESKEER